MEQYLKIKQNLVKIRTQFVLSGDKMLLNQIAIEEQNLSDLDPAKVKGLSIDETIAAIHLRTGARLDKRTITVPEYKAALLQFENMTKAKTA